MVVSSSTSDSSVNPEAIISYEFPETLFTYTERDVALYALGVGACSGDAVDEKELKYVYHKNGQPFIQVLPTFAALFNSGTIQNFKTLPDLQFDPRLLLHGQQYIEIYNSLPSSACVSLFKSDFPGKAAVVEVETTSYEKESGKLLCMNRLTAFLRGAGGFSKSSPPYSYSKYPADQILPVSIPKCQPFAVYEECTQQSQACIIHDNALLYRLSGDYNPLHSDPMIATVAGFSRPILHGLCTLGFAVRAIIKCACNGEPTMVKSILGRFLLHVYPGETLITEMWLEGPR
ncbi:MaoC-like domain [Macleaya cordata]|uniref:MaoC-like domain n=1 Tax=Macleaya cordata TaxID=56857 RepID=A0A200QZY8_MACCD|nr:MaoC-like domain [Macleaya cordata]